MHLIIGPTGIGKTSRSIALAKQTGAPVIALDRIQVYRDLATGSGRPLHHELQGTTRVYLDDHQVADGEVTTAEAYDLLLRHLNVLSLRHRFVIIEGGSISLCTHLFHSGTFDAYAVTLEWLTIRDYLAYRAQLRGRILQMLHAQLGQASMVEELGNVWQQPQQRAFVQTVVGYDAIVAWCHRVGVAPDTAPSLCANAAVRAELADTILDAHLRYAEWQQQVFRQLAPRRSCIDATWPLRHNAPRHTTSAVGRAA